MVAHEVEAFLTGPAVTGRVSASTQNQALGALLFLYRVVLRPATPLGLAVGGAGAAAGGGRNGVSVGEMKGRAACGFHDFGSRPGCCRLAASGLALRASSVVKITPPAFRFTKGERVKR
jgi:hypothetical protein